MTRVERETEITDYIRFLDLVAADLVPRLSPSALRVEVHGFSQGAATAARWAVNGALAVDRLVLWGGGVPPDLDLAQLRKALGAPLHLMVGDEDPYVSPDAVAREVARLEEASVPHRLIRFPGGHRVDVSALPTV
jgi:predicted esterase